MSYNGLQAGFRGRVRNVINVQMSSEILKYKITAMELACCYHVVGAHTAYVLLACPPD